MHQGYKNYSEIPPDLVADIILDPVFPERYHISFVECFKYLGLFIYWYLRETVDVAKHIKAATEVFGAVQKNFYGNTEIPLQLWIQWLNDIVVNALLWGFESWALTSIQAKNIQVFYRWCLQYMLQITVFHKFRNDALLELSDVDGVIFTMRLLQC